LAVSGYLLQFWGSLAIRRQILSLIWEIVQAAIVASWLAIKELEKTGVKRSNIALVCTNSLHR